MKSEVWRELERSGTLKKVTKVIFLIQMFHWQKRLTEAGKNGIFIYMCLATSVWG